MYCLMFFITFFYASVNGQNYGLFHFSRNKDALYKCIENIVGIVNHDQEGEFMKNMLDIVAGLFSGRTVTIYTIDSELSIWLDILLNGDYNFRLRNNQDLRFELKQQLRKALLDCSDVNGDISVAIRNGTNDRLMRKVLPHFIEEKPDIGRLLDFMLVNWPYTIQSMLRTQKRRALLWTYAEQALTILKEVYLTNVIKDKLFLLPYLRLIWRNRAKLFFDARNIGMPYIDHIYAINYTNHTVPHTHGNIKMFVNLSTENLDDRNPMVSQSEVDQILNIHPRLNYSSTNRRDTVFESYKISGMTSADFYFENHRNQFYRILFFFLELKYRGIVIHDEDDGFKNRILVHLVPESVEKILNDDNYYRDYLLARRDYELKMNDTDKVIKRKLLQWRRVQEEDLIMLLLTRLNNRVSNVITSTSTSSTVSTMSTTPKYEESRKGKGKFWRGSSRKCFSKKQKTHDDKSCDSVDNSKEKSGHKSSSSLHGIIETKNGNFGYFSYFSIETNIDISTIIGIITSNTSIINSTLKYDELKKRENKFWKRHTEKSFLKKQDESNYKFYDYDHGKLDRISLSNSQKLIKTKDVNSEQILHFNLNTKTTNTITLTSTRTITSGTKITSGYKKTKVEEKFLSKTKFDDKSYKNYRHDKKSLSGLFKNCTGLLPNGNADCILRNGDFNLPLYYFLFFAKALRSGLTV